MKDDFYCSEDRIVGVLWGTAILGLGIIIGLAACNEGELVRQTLATRPRA